MKVTNSKFKIYNSDNLKLLRKMPDSFIDSVVTDPPYGMSDHPDVVSMLSAWTSGETYKHSSKGGFMSHDWDSFVPQPELWKECIRVLKPGGHCLAFFSTRTYDLGVLAMRLAGFEIRDSIQWLYGQGFPKSTNISKQIAKKPKADLIEFAEALKERRKKLGLTLAEADELITGGSTMYSFLEGRNLKGEIALYPPNKKYYQAIVKHFKLKGWDSIVENGIEYGKDINGNFGYQKDSKRWKKTRKEETIVDERAESWSGWGTALKPACEIVVVARKPFEGTIANNVIKHGTGGINIDKCRIKYTPDNPPIPQLAQGKTKVHSKKSMYDGQSLNKSATGATIGGSLDGRWPSNVILSHHPECEYVGTKKVKSHSKPHALNSKKESYDGWGSSISKRTGEVVGHSDKDGNETVEHYNCHHDCPINVLDNQSGQSKSTKGNQRTGNSNNSLRLNNSKKVQVNCEYNDAGGASRFFYCAKVSRKERNEGLESLPDVNIAKSTNVQGLKSNINTSSGKQRNPNTVTKNDHPTVKPIELMSYLVNLVTPPNGIVLDPFMGSGSTGIAAIKNGFKFIGIEQSADYFKISSKRLEHSKAKLDESSKPKRKLFP